MKKTLFVFTLGVFLCISQSSFAQTPRVAFEKKTKSDFTKTLSGSVSLGGSAYLGDLVQGAPVFKEVSPAVSLGIGTEVSNQFRIRANFSLLGAKGDDKLNKSNTYSNRNLNFKTTIWEFAILGEYDFIKPVTADQKSDMRRIVPYIFAGPGIYHFNPKTTDRHGVQVNLHDIGTEGQLLGNPAYDVNKYKLTQLNLQLGAGARYNISENFTLGLDLSFRKLFTDYLDDVSTATYPLPSQFLAAGQIEASELSFRGDEIGHANLEIKNYPRGNPDRKDLYYTLQIRGTFRFYKFDYNR